MSDAVWYVFPAGAVLLGLVSFLMAKVESRMFDREYPETVDVKPVAISARHHPA